MDKEFRGNAYIIKDGDVLLNYSGGFADLANEIHADQIISKEEAMTALMDYYMNNGRSIKIQWDQLY